MLLQEQLATFENSTATEYPEVEPQPVPTYQVLLPITEFVTVPVLSAFASNCIFVGSETVIDEPLVLLHVKLP